MKNHHQTTTKSLPPSPSVNCQAKGRRRRKRLKWKKQQPTTHNSLLQNEINTEGKEGGKRKPMLSKFTSSCPTPTFAL